MALRIYWTKYFCHKSLNSLYILYSRHEQNRRKSILISNDTLDEFTTQLLQKKITKWDMVNERAKQIQKKDYELIPDCPKFNIDEMKITDLDNAFQSALDKNSDKSLDLLIEACMDRKIIPSMVILLNLLSYLSHTGNCEVLNKIIQLCEVANPEILTINANFAHYIAKAISVNGDTNRAISLFEKVYIENISLRRKIRSMLKHVVVEVVNNRSEAAIVALLQFTRNLLDNHKDIYPLACMWEACFLSEWFSEQMLAIDILKERRNLLTVITGRINLVVNMSLNKRQFDAVLRFLEYLLENNFRTQYSIVIITMFDYNYKRGNLKPCMDIVKWLKEYNIYLDSSLGDKYLNLILNQMKNSTKVVLEKPVNDFKF